MIEPLSVSREPALARLAALAELSPHEMALLDDASRSRKSFGAGREIIAEGQPIDEARILLTGWAYRARMLSDGRRQIIGFLLPGDLIGVCHQQAPVALTSVFALTQIAVCPAPSAELGPGLQEAYAISGALDESYHFTQITRLGRMSAYERIADWVLEVYTRLRLAGVAAGDSFHLPATQEVLADALGLTSVHINRTLQGMRRDGAIELSGHQLTLVDRSGLENLVNYQPPIVSRLGGPIQKCTATDI